MSEENEKKKLDRDFQQWRLMLETVTGASHDRQNLPNQDHGDFYQPNE
ncbi:MAG: hypothetical protein F6K17_38750, partial [Okeania sp. SIO3C4]|nr:hypothetical protein [Okeania sp. SIO3C4]